VLILTGIEEPANMHAAIRAGGGHGPGATSRSGLANLAARVHAAGGRLATRQAGGRFELTAEIPLPAPMSQLADPGS
jgi:hypothetical protein